MLRITFGLALDQSYYPQNNNSELFHYYLGPSGLLNTLENLLGQSGHRNDKEYLRIEQYRQIIVHILSEQTDFFFFEAFQADQFACAKDLLDRRDELLMAGFHFEASAAMPHRLQQFCLLEEIIKGQHPLNLVAGVADRWEALLEIIPERELNISNFYILEPIPLLPPIYQRLIACFESVGK